MGDVYDCSPCSDSTSINKRRERRDHFLLKDNVFNGPERGILFFSSVCSHRSSVLLHFSSSWLLPILKGESAREKKLRRVALWKRGYRKVFDAKLLFAESSAHQSQETAFIFHESVARERVRPFSIRYGIKRCCGLWPVKSTWFLTPSRGL